MDGGIKSGAGWLIWVNGWTDGRTDGWMDEWVYEWIRGSVADGWMGGRTDGWMSGLMGESVDQWMTNSADTRVDRWFISGDRMMNDARMDRQLSVQMIRHRCDQTSHIVSNKLLIIVQVVESITRHTHTHTNTRTQTHTHTHTHTTLGRICGHISGCVYFRIFGRKPVNAYHCLAAADAAR